MSAKPDIKALIKDIIEKGKQLGKITSSGIDEIIGDFEIAPKRIDGKNESCMFCKYKDLCFLEDKDIIDLPKKSFKERD